ncbi:MAG: RsiV family protein [Candidatus Humimicrobiaceae bacterium]
MELSLNYNLANNREIKLPDLFKPGFDYLKFVSDYTINDIKNQILARGGMPDETWIKEGAGPKEINFQTFVLSKDSLIIKLGQYQVAAYAEGLFNVIIPYLGFKDNINPESVISGFLK